MSETEEVPKAEAIPEEVKPEEIAKASVEELENKANQLETDLANARKEAEAARREAKSHQEYGRKQHEELEKQRGLDTKVSGLETRLEVVTEMLADIVDRGEQEDVAQPKRRKSEEYLARIKPAPVVNPQVEAFNQAMSEADGLIKSVGLEMDKSPELEKAYLWFSVYNGQKGLEETKKVVEAKKAEATKVEPKVEPKTEAKKVELSDEEKEKIAREYMIKHDLLKSDTGLPSGGSDSDAEFKKKWGSGELPATKENFARARKLM